MIWDLVEVAARVWVRGSWLSVAVCPAPRQDAGNCDASTLVVHEETNAETANPEPQLVTALRQAANVAGVAGGKLHDRIVDAPRVAGRKALEVLFRCSAENDVIDH
jgi:hypothetical protein